MLMLVLVYFSGIECWEAYASGETTATIWAPAIWPLMMALPAGGILMCFQLVAEILTNIRTLMDCAWEKAEGIPDGQATYSNKLFIVLLVVFSLLTAVCTWMLVNYPLPGLVAMLLLFLFGGVPIFVSLGIMGIAGLYLHFGGSLAITQVPTIIHHSLGNFTLAALPPFILSGFLLQRSGAGEELYELFSKWMGRLPGSLGVSTILSCAFFAAISISSVATVATIGLIAIPALVKRKYDPTFTYGLVGSGATLGIMIPPSGTMILYAMITEESLGRLLIAGILPGLMLSVLFIVYTIFHAVRSNTYEKEAVATWNERWRALGKAIWVILVPTIIVVGIFSGIFTVLECGAVAALYTIVMVLVRRKITLKDIPGLLSECGINAGFIMIIIAGALIMGRFITLLQVPQIAMDTIAAMNPSPGMVIFAIVCLLTVLGLFLEAASIMLITLPVVYPVIISLGFDGIWFAVLMTIAMELALITPPVGMNLYVIQGFTQAKLGTIIRGMLPFFILMLLGMVIVYFYPQISLLLPGLM